MTQDATTYYVWIGGSCDYGHKERAGGAAVIIEQDRKIISKEVIADLHTTSPLEKVPNHIFCLCNLLTINGTFS